MKAFSFVVYGNQEKYVVGMIKNLELIQKFYPDWITYIYIGNDVPDNYIQLYSTYATKIIKTNIGGFMNKFYRYFTIDDDSVEIVIVRDADSRILERDRACIDEFLLSDAMFHIIRDHPNHNHKIMAGMWGIKRGALDKTVYEYFTQWLPGKSIDFWSDTVFLVDVIYPIVINSCLVHDDYNHFRDNAKILPNTLDGLHFIGQVYEFDDQLIEYPKFSR